MMNRGYIQLAVRSINGRIGACASEARTTDTASHKTYLFAVFRIADQRISAITQSN